MKKNKSIIKSLNRIKMLGLLYGVVYVNVYAMLYIIGIFYHFEFYQYINTESRIVNYCWQVERPFKKSGYNSYFYMQKKK